MAFRDKRSTDVLKGCLIRDTTCMFVGDAEMLNQQLDTLGSGAAGAI